MLYRVRVAKKRGVHRRFLRSAETSSTAVPRLCCINLARSAAFGDQIDVASVFSFEASGWWMGTFYRLAGLPMRSAPQASRHHLPLRRNRRRALHVANMRGGASSASRKTCCLYHRASLARSRCNVSVGGFGLYEQMVDLPVHVPKRRQSFWSRGQKLQSPNDRREVVHIRDERSSNR